VKPFIVSVDLGQLSDWTAISVLEERIEKRATRTPSDVRNDTETTIESKVYALRHLERPELRTPYDKIVDKVKAMMATPALQEKADLIVDATGVGRPVIDMMVREGLKPIPITITSGKKVSRDEDDGGYHVPKRDLASSLQVAFATRRIKIAQHLPLAEILMKEIQAFKVKISTSGNETYEAWRESDHDDIVMSVAMGIWWAFWTRKLDTKHHPVNKKSNNDYDILRL
jgi:hypothetical protein